MDNFRLDITSEGREHFDLAFTLAFGKHRTATHYAKTENDKRFVLLWTQDKKATALPVPLNCQAAADLVWHWLQTEAPYGKQPDHDGDNGKGFRVFNEAWGHVEPFGWPAFVAIEPMWAMYGK